ncbi:hypothetical protein ACI77M_12260 [Pseudomonas fildesensis]|uniref:hypothetical protein n=1 Tax=Pseudomonas fildesensis TaxID=1674920 RepID=UPI00387B0985
MATLIPLANNLVINGNFALNGSNWNATAVPPGHVDFSEQSCILRTNGSAEQAMPVLSATGYTFSVYSLITYQGEGAAHVQFQPSGTRESIPLSGNHGWVRQMLMFTTPAGTTTATVQLEGTKGDVWFDNVRLVEEEGPVVPSELILNGDFSAGNLHWTATRPDISSRVTFTAGRCELTLMGYIEQQISVIPEQTYNFSIDARGITGGHGFVRFHLAAGNVPEVELRGDGWDTYTFSLTVPAGVTEFTLQVEGTTFLEVDNLSLTPSGRANTHITSRPPSQENRIMATATARKAPIRKTETQFFQGKIGSADFKADFLEKNLKNNFWLAQGTMKIPPSETSKQVVIFKYSSTLQSGRYSLPDNPEVRRPTHSCPQSVDQEAARFSVILMTIDENPVPAYEAQRGTVEFFHDPNDNSVNGALDVYFVDVNNNEVHMQMLFSI